jgi:peptidyl-prolyl cis-trans isomerase C
MRACGAWLTIMIVWPALAGATPASTNTVATVNGAPILRNELDVEINYRKEQLQAQGQSIPPDQLGTLQESALNTLIDRALLYQVSRKHGVQVESSEIQSQLATIQNRFPSESAFKQALEGMNLSIDAVKTQIMQGLAIQKYIAAEVADNITITDEESLAFYTTNTRFFMRPEQIKASHILVRVAQDAEESQRKTAREKIGQVQRKLQQGEDFAAVAQGFSEGPSAPNGGDLGFFGRGQMVPPFEEAAFALKTGEISDIVETQYGYHIIKLVERKAAGTVPYDESQAEIVRHLKELKTRDEVNTRLEKLRGKAKIETFLQKPKQ